MLPVFKDCTLALKTDHKKARQSRAFWIHVHSCVYFTTPRLHKSFQTSASFVRWQISIVRLLGGMLPFLNTTLLLLKLFVKEQMFMKDAVNVSNWE